MIEDVHPSPPGAEPGTRAPSAGAPSTEHRPGPWIGRPVPGPPAGMFVPVDARRPPGPESATRPMAPAGGLRLTLPADRSAVAAACEAARHWLAGCGWPAHDTSITCIALGHAVECVVRWAEAADGAAPVEVTGTITDRVVDLVVRVDLQLDTLPAPGDRTLALLRLLVGDAVLLRDHDGVAVRLRSRPVGCGSRS